MVKILPTANKAHAGHMGPVFLSTEGVRLSRHSADRGEGWPVSFGAALGSSGSSRTSKRLPDPADELRPEGQLPQALAPGLVDALQQLLGRDELLTDPVQLLVAKVFKVIRL